MATSLGEGKFKPIELPLVYSGELGWIQHFSLRFSSDLQNNKSCVHLCKTSKKNIGKYNFYNTNMYLLNIW